MCFINLLLVASFFFQIQAKDFLQKISLAQDSLNQSTAISNTSEDLIKNVKTYHIQLNTAISIPCQSRRSIDLAGVGAIQQALLFGEKFQDDLCKPAVWKPLTSLYKTLKEEINQQQITLQHFERFNDLNLNILNDYQQTLSSMLQNSGYKSYEEFSNALNKNIKQAYWWNIIFRTSLFIGAAGFYQIFSHWQNAPQCYSLGFLKLAALGLTSVCTLSGAISNKKNTALKHKQIIKRRYDLFNGLKNNVQWENLKVELRKSFFVTGFLYRTGFLDLTLEKESSVQDLEKIVDTAETLYKSLN